MTLAQAFDWNHDDRVDPCLGLSEIGGANGGLGLRKICGAGAQGANGLSLRKGYAAPASKAPAIFGAAAALAPE